MAKQLKGAELAAAIAKADAAAAERTKEREGSKSAKRKEERKESVKKQIADLNKAAVTKKETITKTPAVKQEPAKEKVIKEEIIPLSQPSQERLTGIAKAREEQTIVGTAIKIATDWRVTLGLVATLGGVLAIGAVGAGAIATGGTAVITRTASAINRIGNPTLTTQRAFIGKAATSGVDKLFKVAPKVAKTATRFATNPKSSALSLKWLISKVNMSMAGAGLLLGAVGSYPFAGFIREEAVQQTGFAYSSAEKINDIEGMELADQATDEILDAELSIIDQIPYNNVVVQLREYFKAVRVKSIQNKRTIAELKRDQAGEGIFETSFEKSGKEKVIRDREFQDAQLERDINDRRDSAYFTILKQLEEPFPGGTPIEDLDQIIVREARKSKLFFEGQF